VRALKIDPGVRCRGVSSPGTKAVEAYIAAVDEPAQTRLRELRATIRAAVPKEAVEVISYGMPAFALGRPFFGFAAFKKHIGVFPFSGSILQEFASEVRSYRQTKGSLHLPVDKPIPKDLIRRLVAARIARLHLPQVDSD
jgi:uncharacterized protein YdhG (YjbR/CyaY superfamily)